MPFILNQFQIEEDDFSYVSNLIGWLKKKEESENYYSLIVRNNGAIIIKALTG